MRDRTPRPRPHKARKRFGQHFLEAAWARKVVDALQAGPDDRFIEIGPGRGELTFALAERAREVIAIEIDRDLVSRLQARAPANLTVLCGDVLDVDLETLVRNAGDGPVRIAGNLPYYISSPVLFRLLEASRSVPILDAVLMLQREVADRILARPGSKTYGVLTLQVSLLASVDRLLLLPPGAFRPQPRVASTLLRMRFHPPQVSFGSYLVFDRLLKDLFSQRRKTLLNALRRSAAGSTLEPETALARLGLDGRRRPETLELTELAALAELFTSAATPAML